MEVFMNWIVFLKHIRQVRAYKFFSKTVEKKLNAKNAKGLRKGRKKNKTYKSSKFFMKWCICFEPYKVNKGIEVLF
jgi:hypothetical protein